VNVLAGIYMGIGAVLGYATFYFCVRDEGWSRHPFRMAAVTLMVFPAMLVWPITLVVLFARKEK
jgi:hypothetical protein